MIRIGFLLSLGTLALMGGSYGNRVTEQRLEDQERSLGWMVQQLDLVRGEKESLHQQLTGLSSAYGGLQLALEQRDAEVGLTEAGLAELRGRLEEGQQRYEALFERQAHWKPEELVAKVSEVDRRLEEKHAELMRLLSEALSRAQAGELEAEAARRSLEELRSREAARQLDPDLLWEKLMGPVVQLNGATSVGSGVLLASGPHPDGRGFRTFLLTAWHVVRDMQTDPLQPIDPVPTRIYAQDGTVREEMARVLCYRADLDACLCELESRDPEPFGAYLASRERILAAHTFEPIFAVGCPLGTDPIPTTGQIAAPNHLVDGQRYWMINAPTYIGNSGGGIFDGDNHELLGIFSKIYNHGAVRPTIVPHMGLVTPLAPILDWLVEQGYQRNSAGLLVEVARLQQAGLDAVPTASGIR
jgi:Trypsin-like peptidase domain